MSADDLLHTTTLCLSYTEVSRQNARVGKAPKHNTQGQNPWQRRDHSSKLKAKRKKKTKQDQSVTL